MSKQIDAHILDLYRVECLVGSGAYGHVWKVVDKKTHRQLALKKNFDAFQNSTDAQRTYRQIVVLEQLSHPNIIRLERVIRAKNDRDLYLIFEYMEADLHSVLGDDVLEPIHQRYIAFQILQAVQYLHSVHLIHRDLKPSNLLINSQCEVKICDFGLVRSLDQDYDEKAQVLSDEIATRWYRSPEILLGCQSYGRPIDMWSVGCIIAEMITGSPLFPGNSTIDQLERILVFTGNPTKRELQALDNPFAEQLILQARFTERSRSQLLDNVAPEFVELISRLLQFSAANRLTAEEALQLEMFEEFRGHMASVLNDHVTVKFGIDDNLKVSVSEYRNLIYKDIQKKYPPVAIPKDKQRPSSSKKKHTENVRSRSRDSKKSSKSIKKPPPSTIAAQKSPSKIFAAGGSNVCEKPGPKSSLLQKKPLKKQSKSKLTPKSRKPCNRDPSMLPFDELHKLYKYLK